jgi:hypothetical protein
MPNRLSFLYTPLLFATVALFAFPVPAFAGFMMVPPTDSSGSNAPVATATQANNYGAGTTISSAPNVSPATQAPESLTPVIIDGNGHSNATTTLSTAPVPPSTAALAPRDLGSVEMPTQTTTTTTVTKASSSSSSDIVHGFAKMVPLAVALRQILPPGYGFSVDPDVDLGILISFQGGKPWRETLRDALDPAGLVMHEKGQMVSIGHVDGSTTAAGMPNTIPSIAPVEPAPISVAPEQTTVTQTTVETIAPPPVPREIASQSGSVLVNIDAVPLPAMGSYSSSMADTWRAERGDSLRKIMEGWCRHANVELDWMAEYDYPVQATVNYTGTFEEAVRNILTGFEDAHPQPIGELHTNVALGQRVLVVQSRGNNYTN